MSDRLPTLRFYQDADGDWRWTLMASNGNILSVSSEGYRHRHDCERCWELTRGPLGNVVEVTKEGEILPIADPAMVKRAFQTLELANPGKMLKRFAGKDSEGGL